MAGERIRFDEMNSLYENNEGTLNNLQSRVGTLRMDKEEFASDRSIFVGATAQSVSAYLTEVHGRMLMAWKDIFSFYRILLGRYVDELDGVDENDSSIIEADYLHVFSNQSINVINDYTLLDSSVNTFVSRYNDLLGIVPRLNGAELLVDGLQSSANIARDVENNMGTMDYKYTTAFDDVEQLLNGIEAFTGYNLLGSNGLGFTPGSLSGMSWYNDLNEPLYRMTEFAYQRMVAGGEINYELIADMMVRDVVGGGEMSNVMRGAMLRLYTRDDFDYLSIITIQQQVSIRAAVSLPDTQVGINTAFATIAADVIHYVQNMVDGFLLGTLDIDEERIATILRRSQLLTFIQDPLVNVFGDISLGGFIHQQPPFIIYEGGRFFVSDACMMITGNTLAQDGMLIFNRNLADIEGNNVGDRRSAALSFCLV
jgi:hypothetical protein